MATYRTSEYQNKKDFAAAVTACAHFDRLCVNGQALSGDWSADRTARGENTMMDLYAKAATLLAQSDFEMFRKLSGRFVADAAQKAESDKKSGKISYYGFWQTVDGVDYYLFKNLGNAAKFEQLWIWADALSAALTLSDGAAAEELDGEEDAEETDEMEEIEEPKPWELPVKGRNLSFVQKDGKTVLYDNDSKEFVTVTDESGEEHILEMTEYEPIRAPESTEWDFEKQEDVTVEGELLGYRYRTKADGDWGFISRRFSQILPPQFEGMRTKCICDFAGCSVLAWGRTDDHMLSLWVTIPQENENAEDDYDLVMFSAREMARGWYRRANDGDDAGFEDELWPEWDEAPEEEEPLFTLTLSGSFGGEGSFQYAKSNTADGWYIRLFHTCEDGAWTGQYEARRLYVIQDRFIAVGDQKYAPFRGWDYLTWIDLMERYTAKNAAGYSELKYLCEDYYAVRQDGYWAILQSYYLRNPLLTPYAFTDVEPLVPTGYSLFENEDENEDKDEDNKVYFLLERFGKRGVGVIDANGNDRFAFDKMEWEREPKIEYPVPMEYEKIAFNGLLFTVRRMGFVGEIGLDGEWVAPLHREEK